MVGQKIGLQFLVPLALEMLEKDPLAEGNYYRGDLLNVVLDIPGSFWNVHVDMRDALRRVVTKASELLVSLEEIDARLVRESLAKAPDVLRS